MFSYRFPLLFCAFTHLCSAIPAADPPGQVATFQVHPQVVSFTHPRQTQSIQIVGQTTEGYTKDLHTIAKFQSANDKVATVDERGWIRPVSTGETTITLQVQGESKTIPVRVKLPVSPLATSFRHEVMPVLTKGGCNQGSCHGYSLGKNGFRLSLRGQDADQDFPSIVREHAGRRLNFQSPTESLFLTKARGDVPHEGGPRFSRDSLCDQILTRWIREGAPSDLTDKNEVLSIRLFPDKVVLVPGQQHRLQVIASYSDGTQRDVSQLAVYSANNDQFAMVSEDGLITTRDAGETVIVARFERTFTATGVTVLPPGTKFQPAPVPSNHLIDRHVVEKLNRMKITPSPLASDEQFLRRVYLDLIGLQPKPDEIRAFLADKDPKKREKIADTLFARPEFVDQWSLKWGDLLQNSRNSVSSPSVYLFREFIRSAIASNMPLDEFARRILTAKGGISEDPASVYFAISKDTNDTVERATQVFCGVRMLCARCHAHPLENWTQADYYGVASFFNQVSLRADSRFLTAQNTRVVNISRTAGFATNPRSGRPQPAKFLGGEVPTLPENTDRRVAYANWLTSAKNPLFARSLTNRIWSYFFHRGIIDPVDDIRSTNPPINPALLDALTEDFIAHQFDARHLMRQIVTSATYQRSSQAVEGNRQDEQNFSRSIPRRVPAESLLDSLVQATAIPESFSGAPGGFRATQLPDANTDNDFLRLFGKPQRMDACECERDNGSNMLQALNFINGKSILGRVKNPSARPAFLIRQKLTDEQLITELYLWSIARNPSAKELQAGVEYLKAAGSNRTEAVQDFMWALLNSKDFLLVN